MKRRSLFIALLVMAGWWWWQGQAQNERPQVLSLQNQPTPTTPADENQLKMAVYQVENPAKLKLIYNYENRTTTSDLMGNNNCKFGINGGFYDTAQKPLGLVVTEGVERRKYRENKLFNGFVWVESGSAGVGRLPAAVRPDFAVQSGPVVVLDSQIQELSLTTDKRSRRMVAMTDAQDRLYFGAVYFTQSSVDGIKLAELGRFVKQAMADRQIEVSQVLNLDGGSASGFYSPELTIREWQPVGSWWCEER